MLYCQVLFFYLCHGILYQQAFFYLILSLLLKYLFQILLLFLYNILLRFLLKVFATSSAFMLFAFCILHSISVTVLFPAPEIPVTPIICMCFHTPYLSFNIIGTFIAYLLFSSTSATALGTNLVMSSPAIYSSITMLEDKYPRFPALK